MDAQALMPPGEKRFSDGHSQVVGDSICHYIGSILLATHSLRLLFGLLGLQSKTYRYECELHLDLGNEGLFLGMEA